jgi:hypothetical protein
MVNNSIKEKLDNVSWLLMRLKAEQSIAYPSGTDLEIRMYNTNAIHVALTFRLLFSILTILII